MLLPEYRIGNGLDFSFRIKKIPEITNQDSLVYFNSNLLLFSKYLLFKFMESHCSLTL